MNDNVSNGQFLHPESCIGLSFFQFIFPRLASGPSAVLNYDGTCGEALCITVIVVEMDKGSAK